MKYVFYEIAMAGGGAHRGAFSNPTVGPNVCESTRKYTGVSTFASTSSRALEEKDHEAPKQWCYEWSDQIVTDDFKLVLLVRILRQLPRFVHWKLEAE